MQTITGHTISINGQKIFYREAGRVEDPVILLLHGFPSSSHMYRNLIPLLAMNYRVIAPDMPGFGLSAMPKHDAFDYSFENISDVIERFTEIIGLKKFSMYVFDYGAPVGFRLALRHPDRIQAIISQNGNAYVEGLSVGWLPIKKYWEEPTSENRNALKSLLTDETTQWQYMHGVNDNDDVPPEGYLLDSALLSRSGNDEIQLDLFLSYSTNIKLYPAFQEYFRRYTPPLLAVWGKNDPFFLPEGAEAFKRDIPDAEIKLLDTGHFALETHHTEIAEHIHKFLQLIPLSA